LGLRRARAALAAFGDVDDKEVHDAVAMPNLGWVRNSLDRDRRNQLNAIAETSRTRSPKPVERDHRKQSNAIGGRTNQPAVG
jgi:hypothetical protein